MHVPGVSAEGTVASSIVVVIVVGSEARGFSFLWTVLALGFGFALGLVKVLAQRRMEGRWVEMESAGLEKIYRRGLCAGRKRHDSMGVRIKRWRRIEACGIIG